MITFQFFESCPNSARTLENLRSAAKELGIPDDHISVVEVADPASAEAIHFLGSPTILFDGRDLVSGETPIGFSYSCRIYPFDPVHPGVIPKEVIVRGLQSPRRDS